MDFAIRLGTEEQALPSPKIDLAIAPQRRTFQRRQHYPWFIMVTESNIRDR